MSNWERLMKAADELPESALNSVIDYAEFLKAKLDASQTTVSASTDSPQEEEVSDDETREAINRGLE